MSSSDIIKIIALVTPILALIPPATSAVNGYFQTKIRKQELDHQKVLDWYDRAMDEKKSPECRKMALEAMQISMDCRQSGKLTVLFHQKLSKNLTAIEENKNVTNDSMHKLK